MAVIIAQIAHAFATQSYKVYIAPLGAHYLAYYRTLPYPKTLDNYIMYYL